MSKYEVTHDGDDLGYGIRNNDELGPFACYSEAESNIIVFALNAIAEGKSLATPWPPTLKDGMYRYGGMYDGPTEGVKP